MKKNLILGIVMVLFTAILVVSVNTIAEEGTTIIEPQDTFELKFDNLNKGEKIKWDWEVDQFELNFWIEDSNGNIYYEIFDRSSDSGSFIVPISGTWVLSWENINIESVSYDYGAKLTYSVSIEKVPPIGLEAKPGDGIVTLSWNAVNGSEGYNIYRSTTSGSGFTKINDELVNETLYSDTSVTNDVIYYYYAKAVENNNESEPSNEVSAKPIANDSDGDGVPDPEDAFPDDPTRFEKVSEKKAKEDNLMLYAIVGILIIILIIAILFFVTKKVWKRK